MKIWNSWYDAFEWLSSMGAAETAICVSDWEDGYLTVLKWDGLNLFVHPYPFETGAFFFN